jgi:hypothetical protein
VRRQSPEQACHNPYEGSRNRRLNDALTPGHPRRSLFERGGQKQLLFDCRIESHSPGSVVGSRLEKLKRD